MRYFDTHTHVASPDTKKYPRWSLSGGESLWSKDKALPVEELIRQMDENGVEFTILIQALNTYGYDNSCNIDAVAKYPGRLFGVCSVDFAAENAVKEIAHLVDNCAYVGCRIYRGGKKAPLKADALDDPRTFPTWEYVEARGIPIAIRMEVETIPQVESVLARFPRLTIVLDSAGHPDIHDGPPYPHADCIFALARYKNMYMKMTGATFESYADVPGGNAPFMRALVDHFGADRVIWGSNFPATKGTMKELLEATKGHFSLLSEREQQQIFFDNAYRIYRTQLGAK